MTTTIQPLRRLPTELSIDDIKKIEKRMKANPRCSHVMLLENESLLEVALESINELQKLGVTHSQIGNALALIIGLARQHKQYITQETGQEPEGFCCITLGDKKFNVWLEDHGDIETCPFRRGKIDDQGTYHDCGLSVGPNCEVIIQNVEKNQNITISSLMVHLIRDHHFFMGKVNEHVKPEDLCSLLDFPLPEVEPQWRYFWKHFYHSDDLEDDFLEKAKKYSSSRDWLDAEHHAVYFVQTPTDLIREAEDLSKEALEEEQDKTIVESLKLQLEEKKKKLLSNPEERRLIVVVSDEVVTNFKVIENADLRVSDWSFVVYQFNLAKRLEYPYDSYDHNGIVLKQ